MSDHHHQHQESHQNQEEFKNHGEDRGGMEPDRHHEHGNEGRPDFERNDTPQGHHHEEHGGDRRH